MEAQIKKVHPIVFHILSPFPWKYNATVSVSGEEIQVPNLEIVNIVGPRGMNRSGHVFAPKYVPKVVPTTIPTPRAGASICVPTIPAEAPNVSISEGTSDNATEITTSKGKEVVNEKEHAEKIISAEEGQKFLKLIK